MAPKYDERSMGLGFLVRQKADARVTTLDLYRELRRMAGRFFKHERPNHTLQPTALVHETFIRLCEHGPKEYDSAAHFFAVVARTMHQILIDHHRRKSSKKRGGAWRPVPIEDAHLVASEDQDILALDSALTRLRDLDPKLCQVAEFRLFVGFSSTETRPLDLDRAPYGTVGPWPELGCSASCRQAAAFLRSDSSLIA